jgi:hypothetical protein
MPRFAVAAALVASLLAIAKQHQVLDRAGIFGSCAAVEAAAPTGQQWWACRPGELTGYPDLSRDACTRGAIRGRIRYWRCPATLVVGRTPTEQSTR